MKESKAIAYEHLHIGMRIYDPIHFFFCNFFLTVSFSYFFYYVQYYNTVFIFNTIHFLCMGVGRFHFSMIFSYASELRGENLSPIYCQCMQFSSIYQFQILSFASYEHLHTFSHKCSHPYNRKSWHITSFLYPPRIQIVTLVATICIFVPI